ncbi:hypothetical protein K469DRAFT_698223 [Zopfia rhizophila CBS 207.26]|uniref:THO complex subunit 2 n=1 Tax=Zopfia rhizophila CBS 207.26 TaxID=1314779 RepID=A0A6A6DE86_9PEZI|nr:hypothetical protein K469DRAFT_698223 [Zopfia rhizophila CBS 207.26]
MAPGGKRKRGDRTYSQDSNDGASRPSPHRPQNLGLAQGHQQGNVRGARRSSRTGARGGSNTPRSPTAAQASPTAMSPPVTLQSSAKPPTTTPSPALASPATEPPATDSTSAQAPISNEYVTRERVTAWSGAGRKEVVEVGMNAKAEGDTLTLSVVFEELVQACLDEILEPDAVGSTVQDIVAIPPSSDMPDPVSLFLDSVSTLTEADTSHPSVKPMLEATGIDPARMRGELETNLLSAIPLIRPTFARVAIRKATHALYRQSNYNLLREETEGYSKLITEYFTTVNSEPPSYAVVVDTFQRVKALIGAFDLDVGRVLDVTLDVFATLLVKHNRFFIKLLRVSSWWPEQKVSRGIEWKDQGVSSLPNWALPESPIWYYTDEEKEQQLRLRESRDHEVWKRVEEIGVKAYFELGARCINSGMSSQEMQDKNQSPMEAEAGGPSTQTKGDDMSDSEKILKWSREWMQETCTLPPPGNRIAAQLLGFKLRFYASDARDATDVLPDNLIYLAALLIKIGFISLVDLYPHLYPSDQEMPKLRAKLMKAKKEREDKHRDRSNNALAMAEALPDDTMPAPIARLRESESKAPSKPESERGTPARVEEEVTPKLPEPVDQKTSLLRSLLCIGAIPEALYILGRFPWLLDGYPDLHNYVFRLLHHSLSKVYEWARPFPRGDIPATSKKGTADGSYPQAAPRPSDFPPRKTLRWAKLEENDAGDGTDYRFYWDDWADNVPVCRTVDDVFKLCGSLLSFVGVECGKDPTLLTKLARIGRKSLIEDSSEKNFSRWIDLSATLLAPALSFTGRNPGVVNEVFELFKQFDTATRYSIYNHWFSGPAARIPAIRPKFLEVDGEAKRTLQRISKDNTKPMARALAKVAYACPGVVFARALRQGENYVNLIDALVECSRYFTYLAYDCLTWSLISTIGKDGRDAVQCDGMLTSPWLKNAATLVGKVYKRYSLMSPTPVLQYVTEQLFCRQLHMLAVLEQMIASMAGIGSDVTLTEAQILGLSAGPSLRAFTLEHYLGDQRHLVKVSARRLMRCLVETGLAPQILVALAQELGNYIFRPEFASTPLKVLSINLDNLHSQFGQFLDLLRSNLSVKDFDVTIPDVVELISKFGIDPSIAFTISRQSLSVPVNTARAERRVESAKRTKETESTPKSEPSTQDADRVNGDVLMGGVEDSQTANAEAVRPEDVEMKYSPRMEELPAPNDTVPPNQERSNPEIRALADQLKTAMPDTFGKQIIAIFYITFWQLSLGDLVTPMNEYRVAQSHFAEKTKSLDGRRDVSIQAAKKREADRQVLLDEHDKLVQEASETLGALDRTRKSLREEMSHWFDGIPMVDARSEALHDEILQDCFLPRILMSPQDAQFASAMFKFMHGSGVPGFRTMKFLDQLLRQKLLTHTIFMSTSRESQNFGRFLNEVLKELRNWHANQGNYVKFAHCGGGTRHVPGFGRTFKPDRTPATFLDYEDFRRLLFKWHSHLYRALEACLKSDEYMHIRNAINVLKATTPSFPIVDFMGKSLHQLVQNLSRTEPREDLKLSALSLLGDFKKGEKLWISSQAFHHNRAALNVSNTVSRTGSEQPGTPQPSEPMIAKPLNGAAPESTPTATTTNGVSKATAKGKNEHEDGEVEDEKNQTATTAPAVAQQVKDKELQKPVDQPVETKTAAHSQQRDPGPKSTESGLQASQPATSASRPDSKSASAQHSASGRVPHALPNRPETQASSRSRFSDRPADRLPDYHGHSRHDARTSANTEYGRLDRSGETLRDSFSDRREPSPGRRPRARTPDRGLGSLDRRDAGWGGRDPRDYNDDRSMRPPPRDIRGPPPGRSAGWGDTSRDVREARDLRDARDARDLRDRPMDSRPPPLDSRTRMHSNPPLTTNDVSSYRRDTPQHQSGDRTGNLPGRPQIDRHPANAPPPTLDRSTSGADRPLVNPERAALIESDRGRTESFGSDRDTRRDRGSRPQSPRRGDARMTTAYQARSEVPRDHRDDRNNPQERISHERPPPHGGFPSSRDRREDATGIAPTGPRGGRNDFTEPPTSNRASRDLFQPSQPPRPPVDPNHGRLNQDHPHPPRHQAQDPNYGRLNAPSDMIPSGPRGRNLPSRGGRNFTAPAGHGSSQIPTSPAADRPPLGPVSDRRDQIRRESASHEPNHPPPPPPPPTEPISQDKSGIHPSRLNNFQGPTLQTDVSGPPSGPRNSARTPHGPGASPSTRGPPTGPSSSTDRSGRNQDKSFVRTINNVLTQAAPVAQGNITDRNSSDRGASIRGRANRTGGPSDVSNMPSPAASHPSTPNPSRSDGPHSRIDRSEHVSSRTENSSHDENRAEGRSHRDGRRSERSGRHRSRSPDRDRRSDERSARNDEPEKFSDRERGSGRDKRGGDRDDGRRGRDRDGDRSARDSRDRRERGARDEGRGSGRAEEPVSRRGGPPMVDNPPTWANDGRGDLRNGDSRVRSGGDRRDDRDRRGTRDEGRDSRDGRKRGRGGDEGVPHGDSKRPRRSGN